MLANLLLLTTFFTVVEWNCENLFDTRHDSLKQDSEYTPESIRHWTKKRYYTKRNHLAKTILSSCDDGLPDLVALCEVENDSAVYDLVHRSPLWSVGYQYVMTNSPDERGIDVALLYNPFSFKLLSHCSLRVRTVSGMRPTRDILYAKGLLLSGDSLHVFVVHAPSRYGGERYSRPFRQAVADRLCGAIDSVRTHHPDASILIAGDFNDGADAPSMQTIYKHQIQNITARSMGSNGVKGTYYYKGQWEHIDHIMASPSLCRQVDTVYIHSPLFLLDEDPLYGGYQPRRTYKGYKYQPGFSDHLPLVVRLRF